MNEHQSKKAQNIWQAVLGKIEMRIPKASFETWLKDTSGVAFDEENSTINVKVNSSFTAQYLQERMAGIIERELNNVSEKRIQVNYLQGSEIVQNSKLDTTITPIKNDNKNIFSTQP